MGTDLRKCPALPGRTTLCLTVVPWPHAEMGIYSDNLSAIVIGDNFLPIIVIAQNGLDLSITDIAFVIYFVITDFVIADNKI